MRNMLFYNDKSTIKDELFLLAFIVACIGIGVLCFVYAPEIWVISSSTVKAFGVVLVLAGIMFIPGLIYRLLTNEPKAK